MRRAAALALCLAAGMSGPALAQMDSREGIALQNQILQLRQELEQMRRGQPVAPPVATGRGGGGGGGGELVGQLLDRVSSLEEEVRRLRGRNDVLENQNRRLAADLEKLQGDTNFRFDQLEGRGGSRPATPAAPPAPPPVAGTAPGRAGGGAAPPPGTAATPTGPRTPERAIADGRAALERRDFAAAEAAAREALGNRAGGQRANAQLLLGDALMGRRDFNNAALAFGEAYNAARTGPRAPEALIGFATALNAAGSRRDACGALDELRSNFPNLSGANAERAAAARRAANCR